MLFNKGVPLHSSWWRLWPVHVEFVLIGWTLQLAMAVAHWILPRLRRQQRYGNQVLAWMTFGLLNIGVLVVAAGSWFTALSRLLVVGRIVELTAAFVFTIYIWPRVRSLAG